MRGPDRAEADRQSPEGPDPRRSIGGRPRASRHHRPRAGPFGHRGPYYDPYCDWVPLQWYAQDARSADVGVRRRAAWMLEQKAQRVHVSPYLLAVLENGSPAIRRAATIGLTKCRLSHGPLPSLSDRGLVTMLTAKMAHYPVERVRLNACTCPGQLPKVLRDPVLRQQARRAHDGFSRPYRERSHP